MDGDLAARLDALKSTLTDHVASNNQKFAQYDSLISMFTGGAVPTAAAGTTSSSTSKGDIMTGQHDHVTVNAAPTDGGGASAMMAPAMMAAMGGGGGGFGGLGGGLLGGVLLGSLLGRNGLFGGAGAGSMTDVTQPPANMSIMSTLGDIKQAVAVGTAQMETSQALQSSTLQAQMSQIAAATVAQISGIKDQNNQNTVALMQMLNGVTTAISNDGDKTRALITQQYEQTLTRQLAEAQNALIELRTEGRQRASEINITTQVNQMQQQQQQQAQLNGLQVSLMDAIQSIRATNQAINIGAGTLTANPTNTNTNTRVN